MLKIKDPIGMIVMAIYSVWVILPRFHYTVSVTIIASLVVIFIVMVMFRKPRYINKIGIVMLMFAAISLMYFIVAYPMDTKKAILIFMEQFMMFVPAFFAFYIRENYPRKQKIVLLIFLCVLQVFVGLNTLVALETNPMIVRLLTSGTSEEGKDITYRLLNIGGYGTAYSFVFFFITGLITFVRTNSKKIKIVSIIAMVLSVFILVSAQFGTSILLLLLAIVLFVYYRSTKWTSKAVVIGAILVGVTILPVILRFIADNIGNGILNERLLALADLFQNKSTNDADLGLRNQYLTEGIYLFLKSPLWGHQISVNGVKLIELYSHSSYVDLACCTGIIGLAIYIKATLYSAKLTINQIDKEEKNLFKVGMIVFFVLGMLNPNWGIYEINIVLFLIIPLILDLTQPITKE